MKRQAEPNNEEPLKKVQRLSLDASPLDLIPQELLLLVVSNLNVDDLYQLMQVSSLFHKLTEDPLPWECTFKRDLFYVREHSISHQPCFSFSLSTKGWSDCLLRCQIAICVFTGCGCDLAFLLCFFVLLSAFVLTESQKENWQEDSLSSACLEALVCYQGWKQTYKNCKFLLTKTVNNELTYPISKQLGWESPESLYEGIVIDLNERMPKLPPIVASFYSLPPTLPLAVAFTMFFFFECMPLEVEKEEGLKETGETDVGCLVMRGTGLIEDDIEYLINIVLSTVFDTLGDMIKYHTRFPEKENKICDISLQIGKTMSTYLTPIYNNIGTLNVMKSRLVDNEEEKRNLKDNEYLPYPYLQ
eukprot:TRINITY_DN1897_c0_g1_i1.p1 TRINITY_DN1897_c0_g1~~TRINITY_DN1897_c0_g1_i1.p1  ORF type:complete len:359 (+),score=50.95 TRINITY_DN1897_c0_g1_i1:98-1174(+)